MPVKFVSAKSKVVSSKGSSVLRIELLPRLLLSKLLSAVVNAMSVKVVASKTVCWTDSLIALCWVKKLIKIGRFGWKIELEEFDKKLTIVLEGIFLEKLT